MADSGAAERLSQPARPSEYQAEYNLRVVAFSTGAIADLRKFLAE
jgi:hypothetical protein